MRKILLSLMASLLILTPSAYAKGPSIGIRAGTLGLGVEIEKPITRSIGARIGGNYFTYHYSGTEDNIDYNFDLDLQSVTAILDWHPFDGSFRMSVGILLNGNELEATARGAATYEIGDSTYSSSNVGTLKGEIDFNDIAPYLGIGFDTSFGKERGWGFTFEIGILYQGSPEVDLSADGPIASNPTFQQDLAKEEERLEDELDGFEYYPVIAVGLLYRF